MRQNKTRKLKAVQQRRREDAKVNLSGALGQTRPAILYGKSKAEIKTEELRAGKWGNAKSSSGFPERTELPERVIDHVTNVSVIKPNHRPRFKVVHHAIIPNPESVKALQFASQRFQVQPPGAPAGQGLEGPPHALFGRRRQSLQPKLYRLRGRNPHRPNRVACSSTSRPSPPGASSWRGRSKASPWFR